MKKIAMVMMVVVMMISFCACSQTSKSEQYAMTTVVVEVNYDTDEVVCVDFNGNEWVFFGCEDWMVGDFASMVMDDCGTEIIYDDEIVSVRYDGWLDGAWGYCDGEPVVEF